MRDDTPTRNPLTYAGPAEPDELGQIYRVGDGVRFELGPMPTEIFVATLLPHVLWLGVVGIWLLAALRPPAGWHHWILAVLYVIAAIVAVTRLARYRVVGRTVGGTAEHIYYSGPETYGETVVVDRAKVQSIGVRRSWWRPWVFEVVAVRKKVFWTLSGESQGPVVLLLDLDHDAMSRLAMELREVPSGPPSVLS